ncbi:hypothetical protein NDU88_001276 [Pleurodeles waltl]|uniref:Integrase catalytic domain-containing protein n=1 Tax=Pleurodeles waltl TaxID=8319 RepID=A0AAV7U7N6_PLEWA|nr:hypothetical protein NDU88_001276 [Pleurodeles waltl]
MDPDSFGEQAEVSLVSLGEREIVPKAHMPQNTSKYRQWVTFDGQKVEALRDTGARVSWFVGTPFERVGINIVGPLDPKTALGNRFILVLVDHATRYPEAIPLRTVTAPVVTRALLGIFTHVGFPKEVVSDRGTNFMSSYIKSMWDECGVTYRFTTPYRPQSNGLVERFNKTLKGMISGLTDAMRRKWDVLLPCLLFAYREVPQKEVGFSPFELLYGRPVRGPLSIVKEGWEKAPK